MNLKTNFKISGKRKKIPKMKAGFCFVLAITGLNRLNTGKKDDKLMMHN
jgi:hypothetical protein